MSDTIVNEKPALPEAPAPAPVVIRRYAQITADGVAIGYSQGPGDIDAPNMILIGETDDYTGWTYRDGTWIEPPPAPVTPPPMPTLTRRQLRLALLSIGITTEQIEAIIAAIPDATDRATALIEWQDANTYERDHPLIDDIATAIKVPADQIDALWRWASER